MDLDKKALDLYHATKNCSQGDCSNCPRKDLFKGSNTYECKKNLLSECYEFFNIYIEED